MQTNDNRDQDERLRARMPTRTIAAEMMPTFEALKAANDARIEKIEKRQAADTLLKAKLKKIETPLDRHRSALEQARPALIRARAIPNTSRPGALICS